MDAADEEIPQLAQVVHLEFFPRSFFPDAARGDTYTGMNNKAEVVAHYVVLKADDERVSMAVVQTADEALEILMRIAPPGVTLLPAG